MRILFLTNFYPPHERGGQGQSCQDVVEGLKQRGHQTVVLTSMHGTNNVSIEANGIYRSLYLEMDFVPWRQGLYFFTKRKKREEYNLRCFKRVFEQFKPDIVFIWGMWNIPYSLPVFVEANYPDKIVYRFGDYWPTLPSQYENYWHTPGRNWFTHLSKRLISPIALTLLARDNKRLPLKFEHAICISAATQRTLVEAGISVSGARIIHNGLDVEKYRDLEWHSRTKGESQGLNLVYAGRLSPEKGVDTAIKAMAKIVFDQGLQNIKLSLVGFGSAEYENYLRRLVEKEGLMEYVSFLGRVPSETMPLLLRQFDVLVFPSIWPEPFGRVVLEAMVSGLVVIVTPTGGPREVVTDNENGLLFAPGNADDLAQKIMSLATDQELYRSLTRAGQRTVMERFTVTRMMDEIESYLQEIAFRSVTEGASEAWQLLDGV